METSCLAHPPKDPLVIIRQWQLEFLDNMPCDAALCSFFEYWHNIKLDQAKKAGQANDIAEGYGDRRLQDESLIQYHTSAQLRSGIMNLYSEKTIRVSLKRLEEKGVISIMKNPNPKYAFDKTKYFLFHPDVFDKFLNDYTTKRQKELKNGKNLADVVETSTSNGKNAVRYGKTSTRYGKTSTGETPHKPTPAVAPTLVEVGPETTAEITTKTTTNLPESTKNVLSGISDDKLSYVQTIVDYFNGLKGLYPDKIAAKVNRPVKLETLKYNRYDTILKWFGRGILAKDICDLMTTWIKKLKPNVKLRSINYFENYVVTVGDKPTRKEMSVEEEADMLAFLEKEDMLTDDMLSIYSEKGKELYYAKRNGNGN